MRTPQTEKRLAELFKCKTSKTGDEQISLKEYVDRVKEGQNVIYYITVESIAVVSSSPFLENLRKKGLEVPPMVDSVDKHAVQQRTEFDGKNLKSTTKEGLDLGDEDEKKTRGAESGVQTVVEVDEGGARRQG